MANILSVMQRMFLELADEQQNALLVIMESMLNHKIDSKDLILDSFSKEIDFFKVDAPPSVSQKGNETVKEENQETASASKSYDDILDEFNFDDILPDEKKETKNKIKEENKPKKDKKTGKTIGELKFTLKKSAVEKYCNAIGLDSYCRVNDITKIEDKQKLLETLMEKAREQDNLTIYGLLKLQKKYNLTEVKGIKGVRNNIVRRLKIAAIDLHYLNA